MKHLFVPYQLALLAKEKGFDDPCLFAWKNENNISNSFRKGYRNSLDNVISAPLYQEAINWFREKYGIQFSELPWSKKDKFPKYALHKDGEFLGGFELNKAIEEAFKLI